MKTNAQTQSVDKIPEVVASQGTVAPRGEAKWMRSIPRNPPEHGREIAPTICSSCPTRSKERTTSACTASACATSRCRRSVSKGVFSWGCPYPENRTTQLIPKIPANPNPAWYFFRCSNYCKGAEQLPFMRQ